MSTLPKISSAPTKLDILVYNGSDTVGGVNSQSTSAIVSQFHSLVDPSLRIKVVDNVYLLKERRWEDKTVAVIFGSGVGRKWDKELGEEGRKRIHDFVFKDGGFYLGLCCGGYWESKVSCFTQEGQPTLKTKRPFSLFDGHAIGPLYPTSDYSSLSSAHAVKIAFKTLGEGNLYYQGGCYFNIEHSTKTTKILARYTSFSPSRAAAIRCKAGKGAAVLCGVNPQFEWSESLKKIPHPEFASLASKLCPHEAFRKKVLLELCQAMHLPLKSSAKKSTPLDKRAISLTKESKLNYPLPKRCPSYTPPKKSSFAKTWRIIRCLRSLL